jgi:hypothetical protein
VHELHAAISMHRALRRVMDDMGRALDGLSMSDVLFLVRLASVVRYHGSAAGASDLARARLRVP